MSPATADRLRVLLTPVVSAAGLDLESVEVTPAGRRRVVRVAVDKDGGVSLDDVALVSRAISDALDAGDVMGDQAYVLEVGSPGLDRPLTEPRHWRRAVGRLVAIELVAGDAVTGRVEAADGDGVDLGVAGHDRRLTYAQVRRAHLEVEFTRGAGDSEEEG
ncbi:MAG TPA: ribosome maturation factor RimP [Candidatus Limnocylindria bacterium]|nr:ribosome maturation factor RimP [Candidatus Limnocylindria bacterium]